MTLNLFVINRIEKGFDFSFFSSFSSVINNNCYSNCFLTSGSFRARSRSRLYFVQCRIRMKMMLVPLMQTPGSLLMHVQKEKLDSISRRSFIRTKTSIAKRKYLFSYSVRDIERIRAQECFKLSLFDEIDITFHFLMNK